MPCGEHHLFAVSAAEHAPPDRQAVPAAGPVRADSPSWCTEDSPVHHRGGATGGRSSIANTQSITYMEPFAIVASGARSRVGATPTCFSSQSSGLVIEQRARACDMAVNIRGPVCNVKTGGLALLSATDRERDLRSITRRCRSERVPRRVVMMSKQHDSGRYRALDWSNFAIPPGSAGWTTMMLVLFSSLQQLASQGCWSLLPGELFTGPGHLHRLPHDFGFWGRGPGRWP